jgi:O-antigen ligase
VSVAATNPTASLGGVRPAAFATALGVVFFALLSVPDKVELRDGMTIAQLFFMGSLPFWLAAYLQRSGTVFDPEARLASFAVLLLAGLLILWSILSAFGVENGIRAARPIIALLTAFVIYVLMIGTVTNDRLRLYITVLVGALVLTGIVVIVATFEPSLRSLVYEVGKDRSRGFFKNENQFGIAISTVLPMALGMLFSNRGSRMFWVFCIAILLLSLQLSGSKANLLIMGLTLPTILVLFAFVSYDGMKRIGMIALTIGGCLFFGALAIFILSVLNPRALYILTNVVVEGETTGSLLSRAEVWEQSLRDLNENPLLGVGAGQPVLGLTHSHNLLLEYARTLGAPGLVFMSAMVIVILVTCGLTILRAILYKRAPLGDRRLCIALMFAPVAYLAANFSSDSLGPTTSPFLFSALFLGLAARSLLRPEPFLLKAQAMTR